MIHDEATVQIFRAYLLILLGAFFISGVGLLIAGRVLRRDIRPFAAAHRSWLVMVPLLLISIWLGRWAFIALVTLVSIRGFTEFARATGLHRDWGLVTCVNVGIIAVGLTSWMSDPFLGTHGWFGLFRAVPVYATVLLISVPIIRNRVDGQLQAVSLGIVGFVVIGWMLGHLSFLANADHALGYLLFLIFAVALNDIAACLLGKLLGRHPLRSQISPNKTWEGALGGLAVSMALPWLLHFSFPHFDTLTLVLTGLIVGIGAPLGDLTVSFIKRDIGIKDMGAVIPGHGGVLDRVDSLICSAPLFLHMTNYLHGL